MDRLSPPDDRAAHERVPHGSVVSSLNYAFEGIVIVLRTQRNMRIHVVAAIGALVAGLIAGVSRIELVELLFAGALVIVAEMVNTAIEAAIDVATTSFDPRAKVAKDVAAGAVLVASFVAVAVAYLVFAGHLRSPTSAAIRGVRSSPVELTLIALVIVVLLVITIKSVTGRGTPVWGGLPSGHAAVAFSGFATILFLTANSRHNVLIATLAFALASLVAHTRVEAHVHTGVEVIYGAAVGILVTLAVFQLWS